MVITLHFVVKDLGFFGRGVGDERVLNDGENVVANVDELRLDLELIVLDDGHLVGISLMLCPARGCRLEKESKPLSADGHDARQDDST